jgi:hypothetical protein
MSVKSKLWQMFFYRTMQAYAYISDEGAVTDILHNKRELTGICWYI